jgi:hypothetical protein
LRKHVGLGPARNPHIQAANRQQRFAARVLPLVDVRGFAEPRNLFAEPRGLEDAGDLMIEVNCPGQRIELWLFFHHRDVPAALTQQNGERLPDRAISDDRNVEALSHWTLSGSRGPRS